MSLLLVDIAYLAIKGTISASYQIAKGGYNLVAYARGAEYWTDPTPEKDLLLQEISSLRDEIGQLKSQMKHINEDTFYLVDPNQISNHPDEVVADSETQRKTNITPEPEDLLIED